MKSLSYMNIREQICLITSLLWERRLTNAYGGNIAARAGEDSYLITPSLMAEEKHCALVPDDLILAGLDGTIMEGNGVPSRENEMHAALLSAFPSVGAIIHAHPMNCMIFAAAGKPIPSVTEATEIQGEAGLSKYAPATTPEMCANVVAYYEERRELTESMPLACVLPKHGVVVTGKTLNNAFAMLELVEADAYCAIHMDRAASTRY